MQVATQLQSETKCAFVYICHVAVVPSTAHLAMADSTSDFCAGFEAQSHLTSRMLACLELSTVVLEQHVPWPSVMTLYSTSFRALFVLSALDVEGVILATLRTLKRSRPGEFVYR